MFYAELDTSTHTLRYCNAGQDPPLLISSRDAVRRLQTGGVVLGILDEFPYEEESLEVQPGDVLLSYWLPIYRRGSPAFAMAGPGHSFYLELLKKGVPD